MSLILSSVSWNFGRWTYMLKKIHFNIKQINRVLEENEREQIFIQPESGPEN